MAKIRILFYSDDFKTHQWGTELEKAGCEIVPNTKVRVQFLNVVLKHANTLIKKFFDRERVHVFVFRYLNDSKYLRVSLELFIRDLLTIIVCKLTNAKVIWLMHNIDKETNEYFPFICKMRRAIVSMASHRVLVTDPHLIDYAIQYGIKKNRLDWICFGIPERTVPDQRNIELRDQILDFKNTLQRAGIKKPVVGLCVSAKARKKTHYIYADSIVGVCKNRSDTCVILVMIGNFPDGEEYREAKQRVMESPYILYIDESFPVNETFIADQIDFFYRSMTDYSIAYTLYVACELEKPVITHPLGALPVIIGKEGIGFVIQGNEVDIPALIVRFLASWDPQGGRNFLTKRSWETGAQRLLDNIQKTGIKPQ